MEIKPSSVLLGLGAALAIPVLAKVLRPLAVEAIAAGMGVADEARRVFAEQVEVLEDITAEAKAKREASLAAALAASEGVSTEHGQGEEGAGAVERRRPRRRSSASGRQTS